MRASAPALPLAAATSRRQAPSPGTAAACRRCCLCLSPFPCFLSARRKPSLHASYHPSARQDNEEARQLAERRAWVHHMRAAFSPEGMCRPDGEIDQVCREGCEGCEHSSYH